MTTCRRAVVPPCDKLIAGATSPAIIASLVLRVGDITDVGIVWTAWAEANEAKIKTSAWAEADDSPQSPTISSPAYVQNASTDQVTACIINASGAVAGDKYILENTVVFEAKANASIAFADRTLKRRIQIVVVP